MSVEAPTFHNAGFPTLNGTHRTKDKEISVSIHEFVDQEEPGTLTDTSHWTPAFHLKAPSGWLNDPCGLGYDPSSRLYHVSFQWNPKGNDWGNMSWCHSTSTDLVTWTTSPQPCLTPSTDYDQCGVFTGCLRPTDIDGNPGALTVSYTSVKQLPIHYTLPYARGCESLSLAVSHDGGKTWKRQSKNPILEGPPPNVQVTGWRDPYIGPWPTTANDSKATSSALYGFISGGIVGKTPTVFAYTVNPADLRDWKYIGHLVDVGLNLRPSRWSGDFGVNWEVSSVLSLSNGDDSRTFVIMGTEGCLESSNGNHIRGRLKAQTARTPRQQLWMSLKEPTEDHDKSDTFLRYSFAGFFDHGCLYAANSFHDPQSDQHIVYSWVTEDDLPDDPRHAQGWSGMISLPRAISLSTLHKVICARRSKLTDITSIETESDGQGTYTIRTLGIQPDERMKKLRSNASSSALRHLAVHKTSVPSVPLRTSKWEMEAEFVVSPQCSRVGIQIGHGSGMLCSDLVFLLSEALLTLFVVQTLFTARPFRGNRSMKHSSWNDRNSSTPASIMVLSALPIPYSRTSMIKTAKKKHSGSMRYSIRACWRCLSMSGQRSPHAST